MKITILATTFSDHKSVLRIPEKEALTVRQQSGSRNSMIIITVSPKYQIVAQPTTILFGDDEFNVNDFDISNKRGYCLKFLRFPLNSNQKQEMKDSGKNVVLLDDLESEKAISKGLDQLVTMFNDIDSLVSSGRLLLIFRDGDSNELDEEGFFKKASRIKGGTERIAEIIKKLMAYEDYAELYYHEEMTAMSYAIRELVLSDEKYLDLYVQYISDLDEEHDVYHLGELVPEVFEKHDWSLGLLSLLAVSFIWNQHVDLFEEMQDDSQLLAFLEKEKNLYHLVSELKRFSESEWEEIKDDFLDEDNEITRLINTDKRIK